MFCADNTHVIKDYDGFIVTEDMLNTLDTMLSDYGIQHFFSLPIEKDAEGYALDDHVANVFIDSKDTTAFNLVYLLWSKAVRGLPEEKVRKAIKTWASKIDE